MYKFIRVPKLNKNHIIPRNKAVQSSAKETLSRALVLIRWGSCLMIFTTSLFSIESRYLALDLNYKLLVIALIDFDLLGDYNS